MMFCLAQSESATSSTDKVEAGVQAAAEAVPFMERVGQFFSDNSYTLQNLATVAILLFAGLIIGAMLRQRYWREAFRRIFITHRAKLSFLVLCLYLLIALLDSVAWRDVQLKSDGSVLTNQQGDAILQANGKSLLDRLDAVTFGWDDKVESSFSAPFAKSQFNKTTERTADGRRVRVDKPLEHPGKHWLGTDQVGADVLYKAIKGVRTALIIGGVTTMISIPFALIFGMAAGYFGGWVDEAITFFYTILASIPWILLVIAFVLTFGVGLPQLCIVLGITNWVSLCRVVRGEVLKLRESDFVHAAEAQGAGSWRIQAKHILPNVMHLVVIRAVLMFSGLVLAEAVLSYLNVGVGPETPSWGRMINQGRLELSRDPLIWWNLTAAFVFMFGLVLPANVFGDAVRDALDPRLRLG